MVEQNNYFLQSQLMLNVLTSIKWDCFILKGGTAINFFYENMPRLSVDIDLVYPKIVSRQDSLNEIHQEIHNIRYWMR